MNHVPLVFKMNIELFVSSDGLNLFVAEAKKPTAGIDNSSSFAHVGCVTLTIDSARRAALTEWAVTQLSKMQLDVQAKAMAANTALQAQINSLLAIEGAK